MRENPTLWDNSPVKKENFATFVALEVQILKSTLTTKKVKIG